MRSADITFFEIAIRISLLYQTYNQIANPCLNNCPPHTSAQGGQKNVIYYGQFLLWANYNLYVVAQPGTHIHIKTAG